MWGKYLSASSVRLSKSKHDSFIVSQRLLISCPSSFQSFRWKILAHFLLLTVLPFSPNPKSGREQVEETFQDQKPFILPTLNYARNLRSTTWSSHGKVHSHLWRLKCMDTDHGGLLHYHALINQIDKSLSQPKSQSEHMIGCCRAQGRAFVYFVIGFNSTREAFISRRQKKYQLQRCHQKYNGK